MSAFRQAQYRWDHAEPERDEHEAFLAVVEEIAEDEGAIFDILEGGIDPEPELIRLYMALGYSASRDDLLAFFEAFDQSMTAAIERAAIKRIKSN